MIDCVNIVYLVLLAIFIVATFCLLCFRQYFLGQYSVYCRVGNIGSVFYGVGNLIVSIVFLAILILTIFDLLWGWQYLVCCVFGNFEWDNIWIMTLA